VHAARQMQATFSHAWETSLRPLLAKKARVVIRDYETLSDAQKKELNEHFLENIYPILTPLAVDPGHPFPFISNQSLSLAVMLRHPARDTEHFARLKVPTRRGRWLKVPGLRHHYVPLEDLIRHNAKVLFRGMEIESVHAFRVTRSADVDVSDDAGDLMSAISEELRERKFGSVVRLEIESSTPERVRMLLQQELGIGDEDVVSYSGLLDLAGLFDIADIDLPQFQFEPWEPVVPTRLRHQGESEDQADFFSVIRNGDLLVHHPYQSFAASTERFIEEAAEDPAVLAIKMTLYRTSKDSPIVRALIRAAENGKQVAALIELKARFDEERNIEWAHQLENAGVHVTYGLVGLKTHSKTALVVREEEDTLRRYCHIGTGNYNPATARLYTDFGLLTCRKDIGNDLVNLFHYVTGYAPEQHYDTLVVAPRDMRDRFVELIRAEVKHQKENGNGRIIAKMNSIDDPTIIRELYIASQAGVKIDLIVRGHSRLRPGLPGFSENIRLRSIIGRFLEHSRIFYFKNGGDRVLYIGSADWQRRNLEDRVEVMVPIEEKDLQKRLLRTLKFCLEDNRLAWDLQPDGRYVLAKAKPGEREKPLHNKLMRRVRKHAINEEIPWDL
ncbi:MAG: polyphosphate kinase 1, partial [Rubricoccaceae bacterium]|nr:polyphosphate kinase 1 [Rubricoccaceae bacterium]